MGIIAKEIEVIATFLKKDYPRPIKFRINENRINRVVNIDKIFSIERDKQAGNNMYLYKCQSVIDGIERVFEIKYDLDKCRWILFKI